MRRGTPASVCSCSMIVIRKAEPRDVPQMLAFIHELAKYERLPQEVVATQEDLLRDGFGEQPRYFCLVAEWNGAPAGFAFYLHTYSTWVGRWGIYLEDLFVTPHLRGQGIGRGLLVELARIGVGDKCGRVHWQVLDGNTPSVNLQRVLGQKLLSAWGTAR